MVPLDGGFVNTDQTSEFSSGLCIVLDVNVCLVDLLRPDLLDELHYIIHALFCGLRRSATLNTKQINVRVDP
jgi:hypothetical protein